MSDCGLTSKIKDIGILLFSYWKETKLSWNLKTLLCISYCFLVQFLAKHTAMCYSGIAAINQSCANEFSLDDLPSGDQRSQFPMYSWKRCKWNICFVQRSNADGYRMLQFPLYFLQRCILHKVAKFNSSHFCLEKLII